MIPGLFQIIVRVKKCFYSRRYKGGTIGVERIRRWMETLSEIPMDPDKVKKEDVDREILRVGIIAELDAVNLYEQMAASTENEEIKRVLLNIAREEKTHVGEFQTLLLKLDGEQKKELEEGRKEVEEMQG